MVKSGALLTTSLLLSLPLLAVAAEVPTTAERQAPQKNRTLWIGTTCFPASAAVRSQLSIPNGQGILVRDVAKESPAAVAGLKQNDLLLEANTKPLFRPRDLVRVVTQSNGKPIAIKLLRGGKPRSVTLTPIPRPNRIFANKPSGSNRQPLLDLLDQVLPATPGKSDNTQGQQHPAADLIGNLPDRVQITIGRGEGKLVNFIIERDGEKWEVDAKDLGSLSEKLLPMLEQVLGPDTIAAPPIDQPELLPPGVEFPGIELPTVELPKEISSGTESGKESPKPAKEKKDGT